MFSEPQVKALSSKLSAKYVRTRQYGNLTLSYIEGWHAIAEANRSHRGGQPDLRL
jgi:recombination DNA repair RAD52 pathway protein